MVSRLGKVDSGKFFCFDFYSVKVRGKGLLTVEIKEEDEGVKAGKVDCLSLAVN